MNEEKILPSVEQSLKFMAWNIKQIDESLKKISLTLQSFLTKMSQCEEQKSKETDF